MPTIEKEVLDAALSLDEKARLRLANALMDSLDSATFPKIDSAWLQLAHERIAAYDQGEITALPGEKVFEELDAEFRKRNSA
jgi:putative addiction module component (TIGR02574 family)